MENDLPLYIGFVPEETTDTIAAEFTIAELQHNDNGEVYILPVDHEGFPVSYVGDDTNEAMFRHLRDKVAYDGRVFHSKSELIDFMSTIGWAQI